MILTDTTAGTVIDSAHPLIRGHGLGVTIQGATFGTSGTLKICDQTGACSQYTSSVLSWSANEIRLTVDGTTTNLYPLGTNTWTGTIIAGGGSVSRSVTITVQDKSVSPAISGVSVSPNPVLRGQQATFTITGSGFGLTSGTLKVTDSATGQITNYTASFAAANNFGWNWTDSSVSLTIPPPTTNQLTAGSYTSRGTIITSSNVSSNEYPFPWTVAGGTTSSLNSPATLSQGDSLVSPNGQVRLILQGDGNLVVYQNGAPKWGTSNLGYAPGTYAVVQNDGNFVLYNASWSPVWATNTYGSGPVRLVAQDDGNVVLYRIDNGVAVWSWMSGKIGSANTATDLAAIYAAIQSFLDKIAELKNFIAAQSK